MMVIVHSGRISTLGFAWYRQEDYDAVRAIMVDRDCLPVRYDDWLDRMTEAEEETIADGYNVVRVTIDPRTFTAWCEKRDLKVNAHGRTVFAAQMIGRRVIN